MIFLFKRNRSLAGRTTLQIALLGGSAAATLAALHPAAAAAVIAKVQTLVSCSSPSTGCVVGTNSSSGPGVAGTSKSGIGVDGTSTSGPGMYGLSTGSNGVSGVSTAGYGVFGYSIDSYGVRGFSPVKAGVYGISNGGASPGVFGTASYYGVSGSTITGNGFGVYGTTTNGSGTWGIASGSGTGAGGQSQSGEGVYASSYSGIALRAYSATGVGIRSDTAGTGFAVVGTSTTGSGNGGDFEGGRFGIIGRAQPAGYPLVLTDNSYHNVFYVDGTGDVFYSGNLQPFFRTATGATVTSYTAKSTQPTVEDTGTAQLNAGVATVPLDPTFAATVDQSTPYRVFITPDGDTRGLFVAVKTPRGFIVRETQGGRSNLAFDYRVVASSQGQGGVRMSVTRAGVQPSAPLVPPAPRSEPKLPAPPKP